MDDNAAIITLLANLQREKFWLEQRVQQLEAENAELRQDPVD